MTRFQQKDGKEGRSRISNIVTFYPQQQIPYVRLCQLMNELVALETCFSNRPHFVWPPSAPTKTALQFNDTQTL